MFFSHVEEDPLDSFLDEQFIYSSRQVAINGLSVQVLVSDQA